MDLNRIRQLAGVVLTRPSLHENVAKTILQQMGGAGRVQAMLGAKNFTSTENSVSFRWPNKERKRGNGLRITLRSDDTYDMEFLNVSGSSAKTVKKYEGVYNDQLVDIFEKQTGWFLSLGGGKKPSGSGTKPGPESPGIEKPAATWGGAGPFKHLTDPSNKGESKLNELRALLGEKK